MMANVADDPRYTENFLAIKREIEKLSGINYQFILAQAQQMLDQQVRDLRLAGYFLLANTFVNGIAGLINGLQNYEQLLKQYWHSLFPQKITARQNTISWLNHNRLIVYVTEKENMSIDEINQLSSTLENLNLTIKERFGENVSVLDSIDQWLKIKRKALNTTKLLSSDIVKPVVGKPVITSEAEALQLSTQLQQWYAQQSSLISSAAYARALRWSDMQLPPHEQWQTRILAPRLTGIRQLESLLSGGAALAIYQHCEAMFLEPGGHVFLDLQYHAIHAAQQMSDVNLSIYLEAEIVGLLKRFPDLLKLHFADAMPFANTITRSWLEDLLNTKNDLVTIEIDHNFFLNKVKTKGTHKTSLAELLKKLFTMPTQTFIEEFYKQYAIAQLYMEYKRYDLAIFIFENLDSIIFDFHLVKWNVKLAVAVWQDYYSALLANLKKASDTSRSALLERSNQLRQLICQNDPAKAAALF